MFLWQRSVRIVIVFCKPFVANHHHCHQHQRIWRESNPKITTQSITIKLSSCDAKFRNINILDCDRHRPHHQHIWRESTSKTTTPSTTVKSSSWTQHLQASHQHFELCHRHRHQHIWRESASKNTAPSRTTKSQAETQHLQASAFQTLRFQKLCPIGSLGFFTCETSAAYTFHYIPLVHPHSIPCLYHGHHFIPLVYQHCMPSLYISHIPWCTKYASIPFHWCIVTTYQSPVTQNHYIRTRGDSFAASGSPAYTPCCHCLSFRPAVKWQEPMFDCSSDEGWFCMWMHVYKERYIDNQGLCKP